jgi:hypothetical protein
LGFEFGDEKLTSYAGLELFQGFLRKIPLVRHLREMERRVGFGGDIRFSSMVLLFLGMLAVGARRLRHIRSLENDPVFCRFAQLERLPGERTLSRFLKRFNYRTWPYLDDLNFALVRQSLDTLQPARLTLDVDGSVLTTGLLVDRALRGFNPHHRKNPSYYPITLHVAQTTHVIAHRNRSGNVHDSRAADGFIEGCVRRIRREMAFRGAIELRADSAFFQRPILEMCHRQSLEYAVKVPMMPWLNLRSKIQRLRKRAWESVDRSRQVEGQFLDLRIGCWKRTERVAVYRKKVYHRTRRNYQLDLFDPNDGTWEYSAVATNKNLSLRSLWRFATGQGGHEKTHAELKDGYAYGCIPTNHYGANTAWQKLNVLVHNLMVSYQLATTAEAKPRSSKRTTLRRIESIRTLRFTWLNKAARVVNLSGRRILRLAKSPETERRYARMAEKLHHAA